MYDHLLFDADGTIYDFMACEEFALKNLFKEAHLIVTDEMLEKYHTINGALWSELELGLISLDTLKTERFHRFFRVYEVEFDPLLASDLYLYHLSTSYHLYDDTNEILSEIKKMGIHMSMITNGIAHVQRGRIEATKTAHFFSYIAIGEEMGVLKPDALFFEKTILGIKKLGLPISSPLVIGDSIVSDIDGANNAQLESCWINRYEMDEPEIKHYRYHIKRLEELLEILS